MLNESLFSLPVYKLKDIIFFELTVLHVAIVYILSYVIYKALGRYIYFKPQEHASKVNRTFLSLSIFIVLIHELNSLAIYFPILPEYRWLFTVCTLILFISPLCIGMARLIWMYDKSGNKHSREWHRKYLPISRDYYKTNVHKEEIRGNYSRAWEEEGVESTNKNIHSDALIHLIALSIFITVGVYWAFKSSTVYGSYSYVFFALTSLPIAAIFFDQAIFSWIYYLQLKLLRK